MRRFISLFICIALSLLPLAFPATGYADTFPFIGTLHAGQRPEGLAVDQQTHMLYINYEYPGTIVGFDAIQGSVRWRTALPDSTNDVQVDSSSHRVFASAIKFDNGAGTFAILDGANGHILYKAPAGANDSGIAFDAKLHRVYVSTSDSGSLFVFDVLKGWDAGPLQVHASRLYVGMRSAALGVNSQLGRLYVASSEGAGRVAVINEHTGKLIATIPVAQEPQHPIRVDEATGRVFLVCASGQELDVIDGKTNTVLARTPVAPDPEGIAMNTASGRIYVANEGKEKTVGNTITVIDGQSFASLGTLQVGSSPDGIEADPGLHRVYISLETENAVLEMSDSTELPLKANLTTEIAMSRHAISLLQQASIITLVAMLLTLIGATLGALLPRWRGPGSPRTLPAGASSRSAKRNLPQ